MKTMWIRLWRDESGAASAVAMILLYTILALGATVGLVTLRDQIVQEYGDVAAALDSLDQSWLIPVPGPDPDIGYMEDVDLSISRPFAHPPDSDGNPPAGLEFTAPEGETPPP
jgi:Flp pilus assembly pilin Flp